MTYFFTNVLLLTHVPTLVWVCWWVGALGHAWREKGEKNHPTLLGQDSPKSGRISGFCLLCKAVPSVLLVNMWSVCVLIYVLEMSLASDYD